MLKCNMCGLLALTFSKYVANAGYCDPKLHGLCLKWRYGEGKHEGNGCFDPNEVDPRSFDRKWPGATRAAWSRRPHEVEKSRSSRPPVKRVLSCCGARAQVLTLYDFLPCS